MSGLTSTTVHHLYIRPGDLLPACGVTPGPDRDPCIPDWHTGHALSVLLAVAADGAACCTLCLELAETMS
ncbi:hypothetical protein [Streptomyces sp. NPDC007083]|uniref:hypothetical protein n=1 Tax=Streptomyces sp. NPDC007083 TaxID=3156913 RepID=UPI0033FA577D